MRILVLTKRQYMAKDLLDDRFGRYRELPLELARLGHRVEGLTLSYRRRGEECVTDPSPADNAHVRWQSVNLRRGALPDLGNYFRRARQLIANFHPDIIWAGSDAYHAIFAARLAKEWKIKYIVDVYDNYEAFGATKVPGVRSRLRSAVKQADGVTCFSRRMADQLAETCSLRSPPGVILSGVRRELFFQQDQRACRQRLGLPLDSKIIGVAGALHRSRGIDTLFSAFTILAGERPDIHLALAGPRPARQKIPVGPRVRDFNELPQEAVPTFLNALNLAVISYRHSPQGEYSFPQKAYEIIACGVPLVAAAVGSMNELLASYPECLYRPEESASLAQAIRRQLALPMRVQIAAPSWGDSGARLSEFLQEVVTGRSAGLARGSNC